MTDITIGNRGNLTNAGDPGGRLGPERPLGRPDLRNLALTTFSCRKDDLIFIVTDGIHGMCFDCFQASNNPYH